MCCVVEFKTEQRRVKTEHGRVRTALNRIHQNSPVRKLRILRKSRATVEERTDKQR